MALFGGTTVIKGRVTGAEISTVRQRGVNDTVVALHLIFLGKPNQTITFPLKYAEEFLAKLKVKPGNADKEINILIRNLMLDHKKEMTAYSKEKDIKKREQIQRRISSIQKKMEKLQRQMGTKKKNMHSLIQGFVGKWIRLTLS